MFSPNFSLRIDFKPSEFSIIIFCLLVRASSCSLSSSRFASTYSTTLSCSSSTKHPPMLINKPYHKNWQIKCNKCFLLYRLLLRVMWRQDATNWIPTGQTLTNGLNQNYFENDVGIHFEFMNVLLLKIAKPFWIFSRPFSSRHNSASSDASSSSFNLSLIMPMSMSKSSSWEFHFENLVCAKKKNLSDQVQTTMTFPTK